MKAASVLMTVEAILFGSPAIAINVYAAYEVAHLFPLLFGKYRAGDPNVSLYMLLIDPAVILIGVLALIVVGCLVVKTIYKKQFRFGIAFWIAVFSGLVPSVYLFRLTNVTVVFILIAPLYLLCLHSVVLQLRSRKVR